MYQGSLYHPPVPKRRPTPASTQGKGQGPAQGEGQAQGQGHVLAAEPFYFEITENRNLRIIALRLCLPDCPAFIYMISMVLQLPSMRNQKNNLILEPVPKFISPPPYQHPIFQVLCFLYVIEKKGLSRQSTPYPDKLEGKSGHRQLSG